MPKHTPQPMGEQVVGCLYIECHRPEIRGPRGAHRGWSDRDYVLNIFHVAHREFELLTHWGDARNLVDKEHVFGERTDNVHPEDRLADTVEEMIARYKDVFVGFPSEHDIRMAVQGVYTAMLNSAQHDPMKAALAAIAGLDGDSMSITDVIELAKAALARKAKGGDTE